MLHLRPLTAFALILTAAAAMGSACRNSSTSADQSEVVYGVDNRQDVYAYSDSVRAARMAEVAAAMVSLSAINTSNPNQLGLPTGTLGGSFGVCSDERFANQLTAADCSATLIGPDLVLTAGHCISAGECSGTGFLFDYVMDGENQMRTMTADDLYPCAQVLTRLVDDADYAVVRLARPVVGRTPALVQRQSTALATSAPLWVAGFPSGLPLKIDDGGAVRNANAGTLQYFVANLDTFGGNSGSGVYEQATGRLVGILVRGEQDYVSDGGCLRVNVCSENGCRGEDSTYAFRAIDALCAVVPTASVCGCGNGTCDAAGGETTATCPADCGSSCGDGTCNGGENPSTCPADCGTCGNATCDAGETPGSCCSDCGCPDGQACTASGCAPDPGPGDDCTNPIMITAAGTQTVSGSTTIADADFALSCGATTTARDRVYQFTLTAPTTVVAETTGFDTVLAIRSTCAGPQDLACNDNSEPPGAGGSRIATGVLDAGTYFAIVDGSGSASGSYQLTMQFRCPDRDSDGTCDADDQCPDDASKVEPGMCGCGVADSDTDGDGTSDCVDQCPADPSKTMPGTCGCGEAEGDADDDGTLDCMDACPSNPNKVAAGACGCAVPDTDRDADGIPDCADACTTSAGECDTGGCQSSRGSLGAALMLIGVLVLRRRRR